MKATCVYFSATNTTKTIVSAIAKNITKNVTFNDITNIKICEDINIHKEDLLIIGMPVYAGRIPAIAVNSINKYKGNNSPAIIIAVYGNREFDDALVEMQDLVENNGFRIIAAGAFIAQHSIFPNTAKGRPDNSDFQRIEEFSKLCKKYLSENKEAKIIIPGNHPYKTPGTIPLTIKTTSKCINCGLCIKECPVDAISTEDPRITDYDKCIRCGHCISICKQQARHYSGILYHIAAYKFHKRNKIRKEPQFFFPQ